MLFLLGSTLLIALLLTGTGALFGRVLGIGSIRNPGIYLWLGFFIASTISMFASIFIPIGIVSLGVFLVTGGIGLPVWYIQFRKSISRNGRSELMFFLIFVILSLVGISCIGAFSMGTSGSYDTDLYHAQVIRWLNEYGSPPGLGNLHTRLASNSSWHTFAALIDNGPWDNRSAWLMPTIASIGAFFYFFYEFFCAGKKGVCVYALCILVWMLGDGYFSPTLNYDNPVHIINAIVVLETWYLFAGNVDRDEQIKHASCILALSVSAFLIKPIGAISLIFSSLAGLFLIIHSTKQTISSWLKLYLPALCAVSIWFWRTILLSGYILFPMPVFPMPLDWTIKYQQVKENYEEVLGWARLAGSDYLKSLENGFLFWFKPWLTYHLH